MVVGCVRVARWTLVQTFFGYERLYLVRALRASKLELHSKSTFSSTLLGFWGVVFGPLYILLY